MSGVGFVHLHVHSAFSLLESSLTIKKLAELAKADKQPALALTDTSNLFGVLEFSEKFAEGGLQPIAGATIAVDFADREAAPGAGRARRCSPGSFSSRDPRRATAIFSR
jgi:DNA polymerase-3 subunit alpha